MSHQWSANELIKLRGFPRDVLNGSKRRFRVISRSRCLFWSNRGEYSPPTKWVRLHEARHNKIAAHFYQGSGFSLHPVCHAIFLRLPRVSTMTTKSQRPKGRDGTLSSLNGAIETVELAEGSSRITQAKAAFGSVAALVATIRVGFLLVPSTDRWLT